MPQWLRDRRGALVVIPERSTLPIELTFYDSGGALIETVSSANWSLVDASGTVINSRDEVALSVTAGVGLVVLTGADLANTGESEIERRVTVRAVYDSVLYGEDLTLSEEFVFRVAPLAGIPAGG